MIRTLSLLAAFALMVSASPVQAQNLPDWAVPGATSSTPLGDGGLASMVPCPPGQTPTGPGGSCVGPPPPPVPIDGGLSLLALAGAGLAARRLRRRED